MAMLPSLLGARADAVSLIAIFVALGLIAQEMPNPSWPSACRPKPVLASACDSFAPVREALRLPGASSEPSMISNNALSPM